MRGSVVKRGAIVLGRGRAGPRPGHRANAGEVALAGTARSGTLSGRSPRWSTRLTAALRAEDPADRGRVRGRVAGCGQRRPSGPRHATTATAGICGCTSSRTSARPRSSAVDAGTLNGLYASPAGQRTRTMPGAGLSPRSVPLVHTDRPRDAERRRAVGTPGTERGRMRADRRGPGQHARRLSPGPRTRPAGFLAGVRNDRLAAAFVLLATTVALSARGARAALVRRRPRRQAGRDHGRPSSRCTTAGAARASRRQRGDGAPSTWTL